MRTAILLAAGRGRRLGSLTQGRPKCLLRVGTRTLLEHQLSALQGAGIERVVAVLGYAAPAVEEALGGRPVIRVQNPRHRETNSLYSLWLARDYAGEGFVLLNADVLFDPEILGRLLASPHPDALAVERRPSFDPEDMKVELEGERVRALSKTLPAERAQAENLGVLKFSPAGSRALFACMEELLRQGAEGEMCPYAFDALAPRHPLYAVPVDGSPWIEIDFVDDLLRAREQVWPKILHRRTELALPAPTLEPTARANPSSGLGD